MTTLILVSALTLVTVIVVISSAICLFKKNLLQAEKIAALQNQLAALGAGAIGLDKRILHFEKALSKIKEHQNIIDMGITSSHNYEQAIRLARKGMDMRQLMDNCNLSDEEAHLISRLHGAEQTAQDLH